MNLKDIDDASFKNWVKTTEEELKKDYAKIHEEEQSQYNKTFHGHGVGNDYLRKNAQESAEKTKVDNIKKREEEAKKIRYATQFQGLEDYNLEKIETRKKEIAAREEQERATRLTAEQENKQAEMKASLKKEQEEQKRKAADLQKNQTPLNREQEEGRHQAVADKVNQEKRAGIKKTQDEQLEAHRKNLRERFQREVSGREYEQKKQKGSEKDV